MPSVSGIIETALYADDLKVTVDFYRRVFGFRPILESDRLVALNVAERDVLLLFQKGATDQPFTTPNGGVIPGHSGSGPAHFAFSVAAEELTAWQAELERQGVPVESLVTWPGGAKSLYFRDPDQHVVELLTPGFWSIY